jgi:asparagine synthase (glutamine-hydrolysing)
MCGIVGGCWKRAPHDVETRLAQALRSLKHRGPNDSGVELIRGVDFTVALGHTRLSIIDLGPGGHQPMRSADGRYTIVFNGEIYNYRELRDELRNFGHSFSSESDTEVLLAAWQQWSVEAIKRLTGMFSFAVFDRKTQTLSLARDAFGIKPLFYEQSQDGVLFASELRALLELRMRRPEPDLQTAYDYLVHGDYDSQENSFIKGVKRLSPGSVLQIEPSRAMVAKPTRWWTPTFRENTLTFEEAADCVRERFLNNIRFHLRSDVPLGAALSGGLDSSAVVFGMRHVAPDAPINTFSYIAKGSPLSEEKWVDFVNEKARAVPYKISATPDDLMGDIERMIVHQGEPFGSTSVYAQYKVFQLAREKGVTVMLEGQGADELLAGYNGYPGYRLLSYCENNQLISALGFANQWARWPGRSRRLAAMELGRVLMPDAIYAVSRKAMGRDFYPPWLKVDVFRDAGVTFKEHRPPRSAEWTGKRMLEQMATSLQHRGLPALLRHADRNSMCFSIESRVPFLTTDFADTMLSIPEHYLMSPSGETKSVFRAAMRGIVPDEILDRRDKIGFATPEYEWILHLAPTIRNWIREYGSNCALFNVGQLLQAFEAMTQNKLPFSWQVWRWVNFMRWNSLLLPNP